MLSLSANKANAITILAAADYLFQRIFRDQIYALHFRSRTH